MKKTKAKKTTKKENINSKTKKQNVNTQIQKFKEQYFSFYDDIKDYTRGKEDW